MRDDGPSETARRVAAHRLDFTRVPTAYGDPGADDALAADVAAGHRAPASRIHDYLAARTAFFDRVVTAALDDGVRQVVVGAAGYDGRAFRYAKPGVRWFEVDHPATQRDKLARLTRLGIATEHVRFVAADFRADPVAGLLLAADLDPQAATLFLLEGVAVYLEPTVLSVLLAELRQVAAPPSRLAISLSPSRDHDQAARSRFRATVAALGEPARSQFTPQQAEALLARTGWQITPLATPEEPSRHRPPSVGLLLCTPSAHPQHPQHPQQPQQARRAQKPRQVQSQPQRPHQPQGPLSLPTLLAQTLVAFTIEFDNEAEHQAPHRTTSFGATGGDTVWLTSLVMWENCMRFVADDPITVGELLNLARTRTNLDGMRRWGYLTIDGTAKKIHKGTPGPDAVLRATTRGQAIREVWRPLAAHVEQRWLQRYGADRIVRLRDALHGLVGRLDQDLPDCLPILNADLRSRIPELPPRAEHTDPAGLPMSALLSRALLTFALEYEAASPLSLAVTANLLRVLDAEGIRLRDLPPRTGISKEAVRWALGVLVRGHLAVEEPDPAAARGKVARLTPAGLAAKREYREIQGTIEASWRDRFGPDTIDALRQPLEALAAGHEPPLFRALDPYPGNWRARVRPPVTLPHYPMVLHRGGYPDGS
jgi:methyltransferase (TIGR00027 family)